MDERFSSWLGDAAARTRTIERTEQARAQLRAHRAMQRLEAEVAAAGAGTAADMLAAAGRFIEDADGVGSCLQVLIAAAQEDSFFRPPLRISASEVHAALVLFERPSLSVSLSIATAEAIANKRLSRRGAASISFPGTQSLFKFIKAGGATLSFWEAPPVEASFSGPAGGKCRLVERRRLRDGETFEMDGRRRTFVVDHAMSDMVYLQAVTTLAAAPLTVEYDSANLGFAGASSTDEVSSRTELMLCLLRTMDRVDAAPMFRAMLRSPHFYARWAAMREFLALDADLAWPDLQHMSLCDPHPEVREAALQTIALLVPPTDEPQEELSCLA